jgi:phenylalanyl-tRNA synthetase alpha subunit
VRPFLLSPSEPMNELDQLVHAAQADFEQAAAPADLENAKARYLGKAGRVTELLKGLAALSPEEKKARGADINATKQRIEAALNARRQALADAELQAQLKAEALDVTLPGRKRGGGGLHPITRTMERIEAIFGSMGFDVADGPEIETDWYSFTALNNPENHPARSMQDTFYVDMKDARTREEASRAGADARHSRDRAGPHVSCGQRRHAFADVPSGRRLVGWRERELQGFEGDVPGLHPGLLRDH